MAALGRTRAAVDAAHVRRDYSPLALPPRPPPWTQKDAIERDAAREQQGWEVEPEMVALEARVVGEDFARRQAERRAPQRVRFAGQHHGRESDPVMSQLAAPLRPVFRRRQEMAAVGNERAHFLGHAAAQFRRTAGERDDDRLGVLAQKREDPALEALLHRAALVVHKSTHAASGVTEAIAVTGP